MLEKNQTIVIHDENEQSNSIVVNNELITEEEAKREEEERIRNKNAEIKRFLWWSNGPWFLRKKFFENFKCRYHNCEGNVVPNPSNQ